jgi:xanthine dehydrogenase small subunit
MGVRFLLDGEVVDSGPIDPTMTLLEFLRYRLRKTGTKEGCAEGDCGACTVLIGDLADGQVQWRAVNACILFLPMLDGRALLTVESIGTEAAPSLVQRSMVDCHGSQCGFCTPGFVMSLEGRRIGAVGTRGVPLGDVLAGNLCRCTGYGPILAAGDQAGQGQRDDAAAAETLAELRRDAALDLVWDDPLAGMRRRWLSPLSLEELAKIYAANPDARIIAGATDVGLWVTKQHRVLETIIWLGEVAELRAIEETDAGITLGAGVRYSEAADALGRLHPQLGGLVRRIGGLQVRNSGTVGGNVANGSPIGDTPPALIALGATVTLRKADRRRTMPLENFFLAYGRQDREPGEFVESLFVPRPKPSAVVRITKLSKRFDSDISAVCGAIALEVQDGRITDARIAFGGMAGTPARASHAEAVLTGQQPTASAFDAAAEALAADYAPLTDVRGSSGYRLRAAGNLLRGLALESEPSLATLEPILG